MTKVFIDGSAGTAGLRIRSRLEGRADLDVTVLEGEARKDTEHRREMLNSCDLAVLCLPDAASRESVSMIENPRVRVVDTSTAHRVAPGWAYGFPELSAERREAVISGTRVASPGCHAGGFIVLVQPLIESGILPADALLSCHSLTGYSGGGKKMIAQYESKEKGEELCSPRVYGTTLKHKHLPEMQKVCGLTYPPVFCPVVDDYYKGMAGTIQLHNALLTGHPSAQDICDKLAAYYEGQKLVTVAPFGGEDPMIAANTLAGKDSLQLIVCGHEEQTIVTALFDNLGKGASGAAVQNMNIMLGLDETTGLSL